MTDIKKWQVTSSQYLVNDRWLKLRADSCLTPDGHTIEPYYVMEYDGWINCLVIDTDMNALLVRQYRHGAGVDVLEVVGGMIDATDESPEAAARREIAEELGYTGGKVFQTGVSYSNPSSMTNKNYSFLAVGGSCNQLQDLGAGEAGLQVEKVPVADLWQRMAGSGGVETFQSFHLANIYLAEKFIEASEDPLVAEVKAAMRSVT